MKSFEFFKNMILKGFHSKYNIINEMICLYIFSYPTFEISLRDDRRCRSVISIVIF